MAAPQPPDPVKLFVAILYADAANVDAAVQMMQAEWGPIDFTGPDRPFDVTDYYVAEMGAFETPPRCISAFVSARSVC